MNKLAAIILALSLSLLTGCLWVCRVPVPVVEQFSDEGECTNRIWRSMVTDCRMKSNDCVLYNYYPTLCMRCWPWKELYGKPIPNDWKGEKLYRARMSKAFGWLPLTLTWLGAPLDIVVDTLMLPYDIWRFNRNEK